jgi:hypothetical protein
MISVLFNSAALYAQEAEFGGHYLRSASSPRGNYIYFFDEKELAGKDSALLKATAYFTIERIAYKDMESNATKSPVKSLGRAAPSTTVRELGRYLSADQITSFRQAFGLSSNDAVAEYFKTNRLPDKYPIAYNMVETKQALGHVFLDNDIKQGEVYVYTVTRVGADNNKTEWGYAITQSGAGNYTLPYFKPVLHTIRAADSNVLITWKTPVPADWINKIPKPAPVIADDKESALARTPFSPLLTKVRLYLQEREKFVYTEKLSPVVNSSQDTVTYTYFRKCLPEEAVTAYLVTEDEVYNEGIASDTAFAYAIDQRMVPLIYGIRVQEVLDGIRIAWDALPSKPYLAGVEIGRYNSQDKYDSIATLPASDTMFTDYKVEPGHQYRYQVKAMFLPQLNVSQEMPATGVGAFTVFNRPMPVNNLAASTSNGKVMLSWDKVEDPSFFASFVYRGTSPQNLEVVSGPIRTNQYTDTASSLTSRGEYFYGVINENLREDTSIMSDIVKIVPDKKIETTSPSTIDFYYANGSLRVSWNDVRTMDNAVESFVVMKKTGNTSGFVPVTKQPVAENNIEDIDIKEGLVYEYKVAAVSFRGDTSEYSNAREFKLEPLPPDQVNLFYARNIEEGILVSLPAVEYENRKQYVVYRREATEKDFSKIGTLNGNQYSFTDKAVKEGKVYVYSIGVVTTDNREGAKGKSISVRRKK